MIKLQVWFDNHWKEGIRKYETMEEAEERIKRLKEVGIKARVMPLADL